MFSYIAKSDFLLMSVLLAEIDAPSHTPLKKSKSVYQFPEDLSASFKKDKLNEKAWINLTEKVENYQVLFIFIRLISL